MKVVNLYVCRKCLTESTDKNYILSCEAGHLGITVSQMLERQQELGGWLTWTTTPVKK
jgi:hypothetical protein